jgi:hypothetical protein
VDGVKRCVKDAIERCEAQPPDPVFVQKISSIYVYDLIPTPKKSPDVAESERKYGWVRMTTGTCIRWLLITQVDVEAL